jgi:hypothetical protein
LNTAAKARRFGWPAAGIAISLVLLWWTFRKLDLSEVVGLIGQANPWLLLAAVVVATLTFPLRAIRWRYLLRLEGAALPYAPLWHATAIGFMANNLLPARAGEVARAYAASHLTSVRFTSALASIGVERVMDGLAMVALMALGITAGGFAESASQGTVVRTATFAGAIFAAALIALVVIVNQPAWATTAARRVAGALLPARWSERAVAVFEGLITGLEALRSPARVAIVVFWSLVVWTTYAASFWLCFRAFDLNVPWGGAFLLQALIGFGVAVPAAPGFWGVWEAVTVLTLSLYGIAGDHAASFAVGYHVGTFIPITLLGLWSLSRAQMQLGDLKGGPDKPTPRSTTARLTPPGIR